MSLILLALLALPSAWAKGWEPDRWPPPTPGVDASSARAPGRADLVVVLYRWYHEHVSSKDGARCPYYPTCSGYALTAVQKRGPVVGIMLTMDRFLREYPWMDRFRHYPIVTPHGTPRLHDPVPLPATSDVAAVVPERERPAADP